MKICHLQLFQFRNKKEYALQPDEAFTVLTGSNGCGKTNILESVFFASVGKSFRTSVNDDLIAWDEEEGTILLDLMMRGTKHQLKVRLMRKEAAQFFINDTKIRRKDVMGTLRTVFFSADELRLIKGAPQDRRRFLDLEVSQVSARYYEEILLYQRAVQQRNAALREAQIRGKKPDIDMWDMQIAKGAAYIVKKRKETVARMNDAMKETMACLSGGDENVTIQYILAKGDDETKADMTWFLEKLAAFREEDMRLCQTSVGPHRDDLKFLLNGRDIAHFGSQGQQRTAILALKLAECEYSKTETGEYPILLLDDIGSELDEIRKDALFSYLKQRDMQTLLTMTTNPYAIGKEVRCDEE